jgi:hypothetical protein
MVLLERWLTTDEAANRLQSSHGTAFLDRIITCDEIWIHHREPESKLWSVEWKHPQSPSKKKCWNIIMRGAQQ